MTTGRMIDLTVWVHDDDDAQRAEKAVVRLLESRGLSVDVTANVEWDPEG